MKKIYCLILIFLVMFTLTGCELDLPEIDNSCKHIWSEGEKILDELEENKAIILYTCEKCGEMKVSEGKVIADENTKVSVTINDYYELLVTEINEYYKIWDTIKFSVKKVKNAAVLVFINGKRLSGKTNETNSNYIDFEYTVKYENIYLEIKVSDGGINGEYFGTFLDNADVKCDIANDYLINSFDCLIYNNQYYKNADERLNVERIYDTNEAFWDLLLNDEDCKSYKSTLNIICNDSILYETKPVDNKTDDKSENEEHLMNTTIYFVLTDEDLYLLRISWDEINKDVYSLVISILNKAFKSNYSDKSFSGKYNPAYDGYACVVTTVEELEEFRLLFKDDLENNRYFNLLSLKYDETFFKENQFIAINVIETCMDNYTEVSHSGTSNYTRNIYLKTNYGYMTTMSGSWIIIESNGNNFRTLKGLNIYKDNVLIKENVKKEGKWN